jgi:hypothetical protein
MNVSIIYVSTLFCRMASKDKYIKRTQRHYSSSLSRPPIFPDGSETDDSSASFGFFNFCNNRSISSDTTNTDTSDSCPFPPIKTQPEDISAELISRLKATALKQRKQEEQFISSSVEQQFVSHFNSTTVKKRQASITMDVIDKDNITIEIQTPSPNAQNSGVSRHNRNECPDIDIIGPSPTLSDSNDTYYQPSSCLLTTGTLTSRTLTPISVRSSSSSRGSPNLYPNRDHTTNHVRSNISITPGTLSPISSGACTPCRQSSKLKLDVSDIPNCKSPQYDLNAYKVLPPINQRKQLEYSTTEYLSIQQKQSPHSAREDFEPRIDDHEVSLSNVGLDSIKNDMSLSDVGIDSTRNGKNIIRKLSVDGAVSIPRVFDSCRTDVASKLCAESNIVMKPHPPSIPRRNVTFRVKRARRKSQRNEYGVNLRFRTKDSNIGSYANGIH